MYVYCVYLCINVHMYMVCIYNTYVYVCMYVCMCMLGMYVEQCCPYTQSLILSPDCGQQEEWN